MDLLHAGAYSGNVLQDDGGDGSESGLQGHYFVSDPPVPEKCYTYEDSDSNDYVIDPTHGRS